MRSEAGRVVSQVSAQFVSAMERTYSGALRSFLSRRMRHASADVPDLIQEVFLRLLRVPDHETIRNPQAYLYTIAAHVLHQYTLRNALVAKPLDPADIVAELGASLDTDPETQIELEERFELVGKDLEARSPRAYTTLMMYRCEGATLTDIGKRLGVSRVMAKRYLMQAMTYCQERLSVA